MIVSIFDAKSGDWKGDYITSESNVKLERSLNGFKKSSVVVPAIVQNTDIKAFDIVRFDTNNITIIGRLIEPVYKNDTLTLEFAFGADIHQREQFFFTRSQTLINYSWNNFERHDLKLFGTHTIVNTDLTLYSDQIVRQAMRKTYCKEIATILSTDIVPTPNPNFKFRLDDQRIVDDTLEIKFVSDTVNELMLRNNNSLNQFTIWYLENGDVTDVKPTNPDFRFVNSIQLVDESEYNDVNKAIELLKKQEYNNGIKFQIDYRSATVQLNELLGLPVELYIPIESIQVEGLQNYKIYKNDVVINSIVGGYTYQNGVLTVEFGLPKTDLTTLLGGV